MSDCSDSIIGFKPDQYTSSEIERIKKKREAGRWINALISIAVLNNIFTRNSAPVAGYNILQTDWHTYSLAMAGVPMIVRGAIERDIMIMILHYQMPGKYDQKHIQFWRGLHNGCTTL